MNDVVAQREQATRQSAVELRERLTLHGRGARIDQIGDRFGLHQIQAAVQHGAARELARCRQSRAGGHAGGQHERRHHVASVRADLHDVVARVRARRRKPGDQRIVEGRPIRMGQSHAGRAAGLQVGRAKGARDLDRARPGQPNHGNRPASSGRGKGDDRVVATRQLTGRQHIVIPARSVGFSCAPVRSATAAATTRGSARSNRG